MINMPAIVVVAYNRPKALQRLLSSISEADYPHGNITLIISIDFHPQNNDVVEIAENFDWNYGTKVIKKHSSRMGLKAHVLECGDYSLKYDCIIMLEDDLVVSKDFYYYTIATQHYYEGDERIGGVALYCNEWNNFAFCNFKPLHTPYDIYFRQVCESWGQSWTKNQWEPFSIWMKKSPVLVPQSDMPAQVYSWPETSWGKYFSKFVVENNLFLVIPYVARSTCFSEIGQHTSFKDVSNQVVLMSGVPEDYRLPKFDEGCHYDIFFENMDIQPYLLRWTNNESCRIDLYGTHPVGKERYVLSTVPRPYKIVHQFGLEMRPPEQNVILNIPGNNIFLYDTSIHDKVPMQLFDMFAYNFSGFMLHKIIRYVFKVYFEKIKTKLSIYKREST